MQYRLWSSYDAKDAQRDRLFLTPPPLAEDVAQAQQRDLLFPAIAALAS